MRRRRFLVSALLAGTSAVTSAFATDYAEAAEETGIGDANRAAAPDGRKGLVETHVLWQVPDATPSIALTFDDGPDPLWTPRYLEILARHGIQATFFLIGRRAAAGPDLVRRIRDAGHEIGNHSWSHPRLTESTRREVRTQLERTHGTLTTVLGHPPRLFRPPYGFVDSAGLLEAAQLGYRVVLWSTMVRGAHVAEDARQALTDVHAGSIVLLHDAGPSGRSPALVMALDGLITQLKDKGYGFGTVSGLLSAAGADRSR